MKTSDYRLYRSIQHVGLLEPLVFTNNADSGDVELYGGGHTRLKLLDSIQQERREIGQDPVKVQVVVRDQAVSNNELQLSHLIQNHVRRERKFIDKALQLHECIEAREQELSRKMTQRDIVDWLNENGFPISQSLVNDLLFTAKELYPHLLQALNHGMGRRLVAKIRSLHRTMHEIWKAFGEDMADCQEAFEDTCAESDDESFDIDWFREVMEREICLWCSLDIQYVRAMVQVNQEERKRLIARISSTSTNRSDTPKKRTRPQITQQKVASKVQKTFAATNPPVVSGLPPGIINRRKRYARNLALNLAESADLLDCVSGSMTNPIGFHVISPPDTNDGRKTVVGQCLEYCEQAVLGDNIQQQRLSSDWRVLTPSEIEDVWSLMEVTNTLCGKRRSHPPNTKVKNDANNEEKEDVKSMITH